jgi:hypothetical protein
MVPATAVMIPRTISEGDDEDFATMLIEGWLNIRERWHLSASSCSKIKMTASFHSFPLNSLSVREEKLQSAVLNKPLHP